MKFYDCTRKVFEGAAAFPGDEQFKFNTLKQVSKGDLVNLTSMLIGAHQGTHVDSPYHWIEDGKKLDEMDLSCYCGFCRLIEMPEDKDIITKADLEPYKPQKGEILLVKTKNSLESDEAPFHLGFVGFDYEAGKYLAECGVKTIGIDYLSIEGGTKEGVEPDKYAHQPVLGAGMAVIEGLYFGKDVKPGNYFISALPLKVAGGEGCPVRAVLFDFDK